MPADDENRPADSSASDGTGTAGDTTIQPDRTTPQTPLPIAEPVEDQPAPVDFLAGTESPAVSRLRAQARLTTQDVQSYRRRGKPLPIWVWLVLGGCCLLTLILSLVLILGR